MLREAPQGRQIGLAEIKLVFVMSFHFDEYGQWSSVDNRKCDEIWCTHLSADLYHFHGRLVDAIDSGTIAEPAYLRSEFVFRRESPVEILDFACERLD